MVARAATAKAEAARRRSAVTAARKGLRLGRLRGITSRTRRSGSTAITLSPPRLRRIHIRG